MYVFDFKTVYGLPHLLSKQGQNIIKTLEALNASTLIIENDYIDKYYMIDYSKFHSRSFNAPPRETVRLHFFRNKPFSNDSDLDKFLLECDEKKIKPLNDNYIGFVVVKPIENKSGHKIIGRTIIDPYVEKGRENITYQVVKKTASLFGVPLTVKGLPYQTQDTMVCACATVAIWTALHPLDELFHFPTYAPCEITEIAVKTPSTFRSFPSSSLSLEQMISFFKSQGLDVESLRIRNDRDELIVESDFIERAIKAFLYCNLPIIATLTLKKTGEEDSYHAVAISGYKNDESGKIIELYVHDDGIGPYTITTPVGDLSSWTNQWITEQKCSEVLLDRLIIPIYPKIRLTFTKMQNVFQEYIKKNKHPDELSLCLFLIQVEEYKECLLKSNIENKIEKLKKPFPKFLWIVRGKYKEYPLFDDIYDGTSVFPKQIDNVNYTY